MADIDRYKTRADGRKRRLCLGNEDTCMKEAKTGGLCVTCSNGGIPRAFFLNRAEGELFAHGNIRYIFMGGQTRHLCQALGNTCVSLRLDGDGLCAYHKNGAGA